MLTSGETFLPVIPLKTLLPLSVLFGTYGLLMDFPTSLSALLGTCLGTSVHIATLRLSPPLVLSNKNPYMVSHEHLPCVP